MPNCVVKRCKNQTSKHKKQDGITFHTFPNRDQDIKEKWIAVICDSRKESSWQPTSRSVVCSAHFHDDDLYYTKKGLRRVIKDRCPKILPNIIEGSNNVDLSQLSSVKEESSEPEESSSQNDLNINPSSSLCAILPNTVKELNNVGLSQGPNIKEESTAPDQSNDLNRNQSSSLCVKEEPAVPDQSNDLNLNQSSSLCAKEESTAPDESNDLNLNQRTYLVILPNTIERLNNVGLSQPPTVKEESAASDKSNDLKLSQRSSSCTIQAVKSDSSINDTIRNYQLRQRVILLEKKQKKNKMKIKTLHQKIRRLNKRNKSLKEIIGNLKKQNSN